MAFLVILQSASAAFVEPADLLRDPSQEDWKSLSRFNATATRAQFEERLRDVFDPFGGLSPFLNITDSEVTVFSDTNHSLSVATIAFAANDQIRSPSHSFRWPAAAFNGWQGRPLEGLKIVLEPADIGGQWGAMEDRSTYYKGYGRVQEGDVNLLVSRILRLRLIQLGADVYVTRSDAEPVCGLDVSDVSPIVPRILSGRPYILPSAFRSRTRDVSRSSADYQRIAAEVLLTKTLETRSRAENASRAIRADITIVLQFNATPTSGRTRLTSSNRNIFFVEGSYTAKELSNDARQRLKLLTKLFENVTPTETRVAACIAGRFLEATGFPPVLYGNTAVTRATAAGPYVVARNLAFSREHAGPVVVTEPYFMNQPLTLQRLLAGDYEGEKVIAGIPCASIYREYAEAVAAGLIDSYRQP